MDFRSLYQALNMIRSGGLFVVRGKIRPDVFFPEKRGGTWFLLFKNSLTSGQLFIGGFHDGYFVHFVAFAQLLNNGIAFNHFAKHCILHVEEVCRS